MTKEQEEAIERCNKLIETEHSNWIGITNQKAIETVLNMLKENSAEIHQKNTELAEKNAEIEKYKKLLVDNLAKELNNSIKAKEKANTDLEDLKNKSVLIKRYFKKCDLIKQKDKQIDLMAEYISKQDVEVDICMKNRINADLCNEDYTNCKNCIKQYFEKLVKEKG